MFNVQCAKYRISGTKYGETLSDWFSWQYMDLEETVNELFKKSKELFSHIYALFTVHWVYSYKHNRQVLFWSADIIGEPV